jgi:energy-converting hydrogenase Eha subunit E
MKPAISDRVRRSLTATLIALGAALIFLAPETWPGMVLLVLGVLLELIGVSLRHRRRGRRNSTDSS